MSEIKTKKKNSGTPLNERMKMNKPRKSPRDRKESMKNRDNDVGKNK